MFSVWFLARGSDDFWAHSRNKTKAIANGTQYEKLKTCDQWTIAMYNTQLTVSNM